MVREGCVFEGDRRDGVVEQGGAQGDEGSLAAAVQVDFLGSLGDQQIEGGEEIVDAPAQVALAEEKGVAVHHVVHSVGGEEIAPSFVGQRLSQTADVEGVQRMLFRKGDRQTIFRQVYFRGGVGQVEVDLLFDVQGVGPGRDLQSFVEDRADVSLGFHGVAGAGLAGGAGGAQGAVVGDLLASWEVQEFGEAFFEIGRTQLFAPGSQLVGASGDQLVDRGGAGVDGVALRGDVGDGLVQVFGAADFDGAGLSGVLDEEVDHRLLVVVGKAVGIGADKEI